MFKTYDLTFLMALGFQYFNTGLKGMAILALQDIFKTVLNLSPSETQSCMSIIFLAWTPKLLYGIFTDTFPIFGSRKKSYLVLCGLMQSVSSLAVVIAPSSPAHIVAFCLVNSLSSAVMDVVVDGLMVSNSKKDPLYGSEDLQSYSWIMSGFGGVAGALMGGEITRMSKPFWAFYIISVSGMIMGCLGLTMDKSVESINDDLIKMNFSRRARLVLREVWKGLRLVELNRAVLFFLIMSFVVPSFRDYIYYFEMDVLGFSKFQYALLMTFGFFSLIVGSLIFNACFKQTSLRCVVTCGVVINFIGASFTVLFVRQIYFGLSPMAFVICTSTVTDTFA